MSSRISSIRRRLLILSLFFLSVLCIYGIALYSYQDVLKTELLNHLLKQKDQQLGLKPRRDVLIRHAGLTNEGIGSTIQHFKQSIIMAELLDRYFGIEELRSEHGYDLASIFNTEIAKHNPPLSTPICMMFNRMSREDVNRVVSSACKTGGVGTEEWSQVKRAIAPLFAGCGTIIYHEDYELEERLNGCLKPFMDRVVRSKLCGVKESKNQLSSLNRGALKIGVHIRWGDVAQDSPEYLDPVRAIPFADVMSLVHKIKTCTSDFELRVYAESFPQHKAAELLTYPHTLVDSGDDLQDLCGLADNDVLLVGGSSYGLLAYQLSDAVLSVVTDQGIYKYDVTETNRYKAVKLSEALSDQFNFCSTLHAKLAGRLKHSKAGK